MIDIPEKPILMTGAMVNATLTDLKTQTRRIIKPQPADNERVYFDPEDGVVGFTADPEEKEFKWETCPYGEPGHRLWVREAWRTTKNADHIKPSEIGNGVRVYHECSPEINGHGLGKLRPSIFMCRWMSRITLEITDIRVERLQDISDDDCCSEGIEYYEGGDDWPNGHSGGGYKDYMVDDDMFDLTAKGSFITLWDSINGKPKPGKPDYSWSQNPWVWVITFKRVE